MHSTANKKAWILLSEPVSLPVSKGQGLQLDTLALTTRPVQWTFVVYLFTWERPQLPGVQVQDEGEGGALGGGHSPACQEAQRDGHQSGQSAVFYR